MKSLKEQREKLFQEKLAEMADIGVKKRTEENTPDFDVPIDLDDDSDSVEEDKSVSLQGYYGQEDKISKDIPLDDCTAHTARPEKRKRNARAKDSAPAMDFPEYPQRTRYPQYPGRTPQQAAWAASSSDQQHQPGRPGVR